MRKKRRRRRRKKLSSPLAQAIIQVSILLWFIGWVDERRVENLEDGSSYEDNDYNSNSH